MHQFIETLNDLEEQTARVDGRLFEEAERNRTLRESIARAQKDQAERATEGVQLIRQIAQLECQIEDEECLGSISKDAENKDCQESSMRIQMHQSCEDFLGQCEAFRVKHKAARLDAQVSQLQQEAASVQARLIAAQRATEHAQAQAQKAKRTESASEARYKQAAAARQGLEERVAAEKHKHNTLQHQLADAQRAHLERNKENERAACAAALTQEAIAECLASINAHKAERLQQEKESNRLRHILKHKETELARLRRSMDALQPKKCQPGLSPCTSRAAVHSMVTGCRKAPLQQQQTYAPKAFHQQAPRAVVAAHTPAGHWQEQSIANQQGWPVPAVAALTARPVPSEQQKRQPSPPHAALPTALQLHSHSPAGDTSSWQSARGQGAAMPAHLHNQEAMERPRLPYTVTEPDSPQAQGSGQGQALEGQAAAPRAEQLPGPACVFTETTVTRTVTPTKAGCSRQESWRVQEMHRVEGNSRQQLHYSVFTGADPSFIEGAAEAPHARTGSNSQGRGRGRRQKGRGKAGAKPRRTLKRLYTDKEEPSPFDWEARRQAEEDADVAEQDILLSSIWN